MISPTGNTLTYQNLNNPAFQCTDGSLMLSIFENALGFPIELEDPDADHYLKTQLPVFAKNGAGRLQPVVSWLAHAPSESFLFAHNEDVYEALTGLKHINFYKSTVPVTSPNAFSNACKVMSEKGVAISGVSEAIFELIHQKYITFPNKMEQFQQHLNSVEA